MSSLLLVLNHNRAVHKATGNLQKSEVRLPFFVPFCMKRQNNFPQKIYMARTYFFCPEGGKQRKIEMVPKSLPLKFVSHSEATFYFHTYPIFCFAVFWPKDPKIDLFIDSYKVLYQPN